MGYETPFSFDEYYPNHQWWRGGPEKLADFTAELALYRSGLDRLLQYLSTGNFTKVIILGFSAANMMHDLNTVNVAGLSLPPWISLTGPNKWKLTSWPAKAQEYYQTLNIPFTGGVILDDFADTAKKAKDLYRFIIKPLKIPASFAFLTATKTAEISMNRAGIQPFIAITDASDKMIELLNLRKSPSSMT